MRLFYERCLGFEVRQAAESYCLLESDAWRLSLVSIPDAIVAGIEISVPPRRRESEPVKLAFAVQSIAEVRLIATGLGGQVDPDSTRWEFDGLGHCDGVDPEGNVIQLLEPLSPPA